MPERWEKVVAKNGQYFELKFFFFIFLQSNVEFGKQQHDTSNTPYLVRSWIFSFIAPIPISLYFENGSP